MSVEAKQSRKRLNVIFGLYVLIAIAIVIGLYAVLEVRRSDSERERPITFDEPITPDKAQAILDRANEANNFAGLLLSFIEAASAILGVFMIVGAYIFRRSILDEFEKAIQRIDWMEKEAQNREKRLKERENELNALREQLTSKVDTLIADNHQSFEDIRGRASDSLHVVSLQLMAEQQVRAHNLDTALKTLTTAYDLDTTNQTTNYLLGYLHTSRKEFDQAIEHLESALKQQETESAQKQQETRFTPALAALGLALRRKGDAMTNAARFEERNRLWSQAENRLLEALKLDPSLADMEGESYYGTLGGLYRRQGRYEDALNAYEKARSVKPSSTYPIINLASLYTRQGNLEQARHYFERVLHNAKLSLDDNPRNMWTRMDYSQALLVLGEPDKALAQLQMVLSQGPEQGLLETVLSGLRFLAESPRPVKGLDTLIDEMEKALTEMQDSRAGADALAAGTSGDG